MATDGTSNVTVPTTGTAIVPHYRQKRMGPAPFASFEDLSDEVRARLDSPEEKSAQGSVVRLPGIREDVTPSTPALNMSRGPEFVYTAISLVGQVKTPVNPSTSFADAVSAAATSASNLQAPTAPRIDISRASSSSHHDSKDSSPDKEAVCENIGDQGTAKLGVGYREDGTLDLRSSTEELDFQDRKEDDKRKARSRPQSPACLIEDPYQNHTRKDSQCSEIGLLSISGRTSRLSSIGSGGSGQSRLSNASHLSVLSGTSRSPSPHKMLLETSFCGSRSPQSLSSVTIDQTGTKTEADDLEKVLLSRKHDPTVAIIADGGSNAKKPPEKPARKAPNVKSEVTIKVDTPDSQTPRPSKRILSESGVEYIYIPLKGPLPEDLEDRTARTKQKQTSNIKPLSAPPLGKQTQATKPAPLTKSAQQRPQYDKTVKNEPKYIRIKLKPDYLYDDAAESGPSKTEVIDFDEIRTDDSATTSTAKSLASTQSFASTPSASPKFQRRTRDFNLDGSSKTPSPSLSRKSSFASIFRSKEAITSPESPTIPGRRKNTITGILKEASDSLRDRSRSRSRSESRERDSPLNVSNSTIESTDSRTSKQNQKGMFSIFRTSKKDGKKIEAEPQSDILTKVEFKFNETTGMKPNKLFEKPLEGDSVRIPLHSPTHYEETNRLLKDISVLVQTPSQESQDTVIEVAPVKKEEEPPPQPPPAPVPKNLIECQSSTSSENVIFTTNVGSTNEIFTTKLPKEKANGNVPGLVTELSNKIVEAVQIETKETPPPPSRIERTRSTTSLKKMLEENIRKMEKEEDRNNSSESERDSESGSLPPILKPNEIESRELLEPECKSLVVQESFEYELPYVPTTLPLERSSAVPIVPIKQRSTYEMKTCPIDRPRSTTPINPSSLDDYCEEIVSHVPPETIRQITEKLKISLPRSDSSNQPKSPKKTTTKNTTWTEFAEKGIHTGRKSSTESDTPPPLPPKGLQKEWINFEDVPERRKLPKRIQTIPSRGHIDVPDHLHQDVVYNYVNPEECKCECHEKKDVQQPVATVQEDEVPLLENEDDEKMERLKTDLDMSNNRSHQIELHSPESPTAFSKTS